jgi:putative transposase
MSSVVVALLHTLRTSFRTRAALEAKILALRHQLQVLQRSRPRQLRLTRADRVLWVWLSRIWSGWRTTTVLVKPATVIA